MQTWKVTESLLLASLSHVLDNSAVQQEKRSTAGEIPPSYNQRLWICIHFVFGIFCFFQEPEDLFETISQAMLNAVDRDAVSGMGVIVHVM